MQIELKVKDVIGQDEDKRHVFLVDNEEFKRCIMQHKGFSEINNRNIQITNNKKGYDRTRS